MAKLTLDVKRRGTYFITRDGKSTLLDNRMNRVFKAELRGSENGDRPSEYAVEQLMGDIVDTTGLTLTAAEAFTVLKRSRAALMLAEAMPKKRAAWRKEIIDGVAQIVREKVSTDSGLRDLSGRSGRPVKKSSAKDVDVCRLVLLRDFRQAHGHEHHGSRCTCIPIVAKKLRISATKLRADEKSCRAECGSMAKYGAMLDSFKSGDGFDQIMQANPHWQTFAKQTKLDATENALHKVVDSQPEL